MDVKTSRITYPKSVLSLYLKLFCKRRNSDKNKMLEGIQSWLTLSKSEKQQFFDKYKECRLNHKVKLANYLTKVQPYLKKKDVKRTSTNKVKRSENTKLETQGFFQQETVIVSKDLENDHLEITNNDEILNYNNHPTLESNEQRESMSRSIEEIRPALFEEIRPALVEPSPPSVRTARELFEMLKSTSKDINHESWATLSKLQKNRYQQAIQLLKNQYIRNYKEYLESLPPKELFNCYNNYFN